MIKFLKNLVKGRKQQCNIPDVSKSLPDHYAGELNTKRIKAYKLLHEQYNLEEGTEGYAAYPTQHFRFIPEQGDIGYSSKIIRLDIDIDEYFD